MEEQSIFVQVMPQGYLPDDILEVTEIVEAAGIMVDGVVGEAQNPGVQVLQAGQMGNAIQVVGSHGPVDPATIVTTADTHYLADGDDGTMVAISADNLQYTTASTAGNGVELGGTAMGTGVGLITSSAVVGQEVGTTTTIPAAAAVVSGLANADNHHHLTTSAESSEHDAIHLLVAASERQQRLQEANHGEAHSSTASIGTATGTHSSSAPPPEHSSLVDLVEGNERRQRLLQLQQQRAQQTMHQQMIAQGQRDDVEVVEEHQVSAAIHFSAD